MKKTAGTDYSIKHITIKDGAKEYCVGFRCSLLRGVRVVDLHGFSPDAEVISTYPPLLGVIGHMLMESPSGLCGRIGIHVANRFGNRCN